MIDPPRQNWADYEARAAEADAAWLRGLTIDEKFSLYEDLFRIVHSARGEGDWQRLEQWQWQEKLAAREEFVKAMRKLDQRNGRTAAKDSG